MFLNPDPLAFVTAALLATILRLFLYILGVREGEYLRDAIAEMGATVVVLETLIVMLRFFTTLRILKLLTGAGLVGKMMEAPLFVCCGLAITWLWTTLPKLLGLRPVWGDTNHAIAYLAHRPFEPLPIIFEYLVLYSIHNRHVKYDQMFFLLCLAMVAVIIAIYNVPRTTTRSPQMLFASDADARLETIAPADQHIVGSKLDN